MTEKNMLKYINEMGEYETAYGWTKNPKKGYYQLTAEPASNGDGKWRLQKDSRLYMWVDKIVKVYDENDPMAEETEK